MFQLCDLGPLNIYTVGIHAKKINTCSNEKDQAGKEVKSKREQNIKLDFLSLFFSALLLLMCYFTLNTSDNTSCFDPKGLFAP